MCDRSFGAKFGAVFSALLMGFPFLAYDASAEVLAQPDSVTFHDYADMAEVVVTRNGQPVPASELGSWRFLVEDNHYERMIKVERHDGVLVIRPTDVLETGHYTFTIEVGSETVTIDVSAPLDRLPDSFEQQAKAKGLTTEELKEQLGLYTRPGRNSIALELSERYPIGTRFDLAMDIPEQNRYQWLHNGTEAMSGSGPHAFAAILDTPGSHDFRYIETNDSGLRLETSAKTTAYEEPPIPFETEEGKNVLLRCPEGYANCSWTVNGEDQPDTGDLTYLFQIPGDYSVECKASNPDGGFRIVRYEVTVR